MIYPNHKYRFLLSMYCNLIFTYKSYNYNLQLCSTNIYKIFFLYYKQMLLNSSLSKQRGVSSILLESTISNPYL